MELTGSGYLRQAFTQRQEHIHEAVKWLGQFQFDAIAFTGLSGSLIAPVIADRMNKGLIGIRKEPSPHADDLIEGYLDSEYVIVDDFMETGHTVRRIVDEIGDRAKCIGVYFYMWCNDPIDPENRRIFESRIDGLPILNSRSPQMEPIVAKSKPTPVPMFWSFGLTPNLELAT